jgi:hypothetical protein
MHQPQEIMESWQRGRRELLEEIANIYDKIRLNVDAGKRKSQTHGCGDHANHITSQNSTTKTMY